MTIDERDNDQLGAILRYCTRLEATLARFDEDYNVFLDDAVFQDSCALCLIQIGEAVNRLSEGFRASHPSIEWSLIYGMRCRLVHGYDMFDADIAWETITQEIPPLKVFCEERYREEG